MVTLLKDLNARLLGGKNDFTKFRLDLFIKNSFFHVNGVLGFWGFGEIGRAHV